MVTELKADQIYVLSNNPSTLFKGDTDYASSNILKIVLRAISIFIQDVRENNIAELEEYKQISGATIYRIESDEDLDPEHPTGLNFDSVLMGVWMEIGKKKALEIVPQP